MVQTGCAQWRSGIAEAGRAFCGSQVRLLIRPHVFRFAPRQLFRRSVHDPPSERTHQQEPKPEPKVPPP